VRVVRWTATLCGLVVLVVTLAILLFIGTQCIGTGGEGRAREIPAAAAGVAGYTRPEAATYLALPGWYVVYAAEAYAGYIDGRAPSGFPHFGTVWQFWRYYGRMCEVTRDRYTFDAGMHLLVGAIGVGFSAEHLAKGAYENTVGRAAEWIAGHDTAEDAFAARTAREYARFVRTAPWYDFPFAARLEAFWRDTPLRGPGVVRKWERRAEYGMKAVYGALVRAAAKGVADTEDGEIHLWAENVPARAFADTRITRVAEVARGAYILRVPRGEAFAEIVSALARQGARFREIAGNDEILLTAWTRRGGGYDLEAGRVVLTEPVLTAPDAQRIAVAAPVRSLHVILAGLARRGVALERLYDY
jgi:hypothetical protein